MGARYLLRQTQGHGTNRYQQKLRKKFSDIEATDENGGIDRFAYYDKAQNDLTGGYTLSGTPTWAAGAYTLDSAERMIRALPSTCTTGTWEKVSSFETPWADIQYDYIWLGSTADPSSFLQIKRTDAPAANEIWLALWINSSLVIASTDTTKTLADSTYGRATVTYDGTDWSIYWNGVLVGTGAGDAITTPSIGTEPYLTQCKCIDLSYSPSISYTDDASADLTARYKTVSGTAIAFDTDHYHIIANTDSKYRLQSYQFKNGNRKFMFTLPAAGSNGDYINMRLCSTADLSIGYGVGLIRTAGKWNFYTVKDTTGTDTGTDSLLADGNSFYVEVDRDSDRGVHYYYVYATTKPTAPTGTIYGAYSYGYSGVVVHSAAGSKTFVLNSIEIRAQLLIGETNIPQTESGFYFRDEFGSNSIGRYTTVPGTGGTIAISGGVLSVSYAGGTATVDHYVRLLQDTLFLNGLITYETDITFSDASSAAQALRLVLTDTQSTTNGRSGYQIKITAYGADNFELARLSAAGTATSLGSATKTVNAATTYHLKFTLNTTTGELNGYFNNEVSPSVTATDTTYPNPKQVSSRISTRLNGDTITIDNLTISGTRYYMKPILRGAQRGEYWNGSATVDATTFCGDGCWDWSTEVTGVGGAATWDTTNGFFSFTSANDGVKPNNLKWTSQVISAKISTTHTSNIPAITLLDDGSDGGSFASLVAGTKYVVYPTSTTNIRLSKVLAGVATTLKDCTVPTITANTVNDLMIVYLSSTGSFSIYWNGALVGTATDTAITTANPTGFGIAGFNSGSVKYYQVIIDGYESTSTNGVAWMIGGTAHGGLFETCTQAGYTLTDITPDYRGYYRVKARYGKSTSTSTYKMYYKNNDGTTVLKNNSSSFSGTGAPQYISTDKIIKLDHDDLGDDIQILLTYDTASGTYPATYLTELSMEPVDILPSAIWTDGNMTESPLFGVTYHPTVLGNLTAVVDMGTVGYHFNAIDGRVTAPSLNPYIYSGTVSREFINKMYSATFEFAGKDTGYNIYSGLYFKHVQFTIPDYLGANNCVFVGFFPGSTTTVSPGEDHQSLTAYDYGYYLSNQPLDFNDLVLLTPTDQALETKHQLYFNTGTARMNIGDRIVGGTSGDAGTVIETYGLTSGHIVMKGCTGGTAPYFTDAENLKRCGVTVAKADGYTTDVTGTISIVYPDDWIRNVLGGTDWLKKTGIEPYKINNTATIWDVTIPACTMTWEETQSKMSAIEDWCQKLKWIFLVKWRWDATNSLYRPGAYFVDEADIDDPINGLDLPATVTITKPSKYLSKPIVIDQKGNERVNKVTVKCQGFNGTWYTSADIVGTTCSSGVDSGDEIPIIKKEINPNITTQAEADDRASDLYAYYQSQIVIYRATFTMRSDFQLLQKLTFSGYDATEIPDGTYRIIGIEYHYAAQGNEIINEQTVTLIDSSKFASYLKLSRVFTGSIWVIQKLIEFDRKKQKTIETATVTAVAGDEITVIDDAGIVRKARDAT